MSKGVPMAEYVALKAFSGGLAARLLADSPYMAWWDSPWNPDRPRDDSPEADRGTAAHAILLEGSEAGLAVIDPRDHPSKPTKADPDGKVPTGWTNNAIRAARDAAYAAGLTPVLPEQVAAIRAMVTAARAYVTQTELAGILDEGEAELTFTWSEAGVPCKIRPDRLWLERGIILSYKTVKTTANPRAWIRTQLPGYEVGMPLYERGIRACCGTERPRVVHLIQSQAAPYGCSLVALAPSRQDFAERQLDTALALWKRCLSEKRFPNYPTEICYAETVAWQEAAFAEQYEGTGEPTEAEVMAALQRGTGSPVDFEMGGQP